MSAGNTKEKVTQMVQDARQQTTEGRFHTAYETLRYANQLAEKEESLANLNDVILQDIASVQSQAQSLIQNIQSEIEAALAFVPALNNILINPDSDQLEVDEFVNQTHEDIKRYIDQWREDANERMVKWQNSILHGNDSEWQETVRRIEQYPKRLLHDLYFEAIQRECERLWKRPDELIEMDDAVSPSRLLAIVTKARDIAVRAAGLYPQSVDFDTLKDRADRIRTERAGSYQVFTSAVQGEYFAAEIKRLESTKPDEMIPVLTFVADPNDPSKQVEQVQGYRRAEEAKTILEDMARQWAQELSEKYYDEAKQALEDYNPATALEILENRTKIYEFLGDEYKRDLEEMLVEAQAAQANWERASQMVQLIPDYQNQPTVALQMYNEAIAVYPATDVEASYATVLGYITVDLTQRQEQMKQAHDQHDVGQTRIILTNAKDDYQQVDDPRVKAILTSMERLHEQTQKFNDDLNEARQQLNNIRNQSRNDPQQAATQLQAFAVKYSQQIPFLSDYEEIERESATYLGATDTYNKLVADMKTDKIARVESSVQNARQARSRYADDDRFIELVSNLEGHLDYLLGRQLFEIERDYEQARTYFERIRHAHQDYAQADRYLREIRNQLGKEKDIDAKIASAQKHFDNQEPVEAYRILKDLNPITDLQRSVLRNLRLDAEDAALRVLRDEAQALYDASESWNPDDLTRINEVSDRINRIDELINTLKVLGFSELLSDWQREVRPYVIAQHAWLSTAGDVNSKQYQTAIQRLNSAIEHATKYNQTGAERLCSRLLHRIRKRDLKVQLDNLYRNINRDDADNGQDANSVDEDVRRVEEAFSQFLDDYNNEPEVLLWFAEVYRIGGGYSTSPKHRKRFFGRMASMAEGVQRLSGATDYHKRAKEFYDDAIASLEVVDVMQDIQSRLEKDTLDDVSLAGELYRKHIQSHSSLSVRTWWSNTRDNYIEKVQTQLPDTKDNARITASELVPLAKIVTIQPNHARAKRMLNNFNTFWQEINKNVRDFVDSYAIAGGISGENGLKRLRLQIRLGETYSSNLSAIAYIPQVIQDDSISREISGLASQMNTEIKGVVEILNRLLTSVEQGTTLLQQEQGKGTFTHTTNLLDSIPAHLSQHPAVVDLQEQLTSAKGGVDNLIQLMNAVKQHVESENYAEARNVFLNIKKADLSARGLNEKFDISDPMKVWGTFTTYDDVKNMLERRYQALLQVENYVKPLRSLREDEGLTALKVSSSAQTSLPNVMRWSEQKARIDAAIQQADFETAIQIAEMALNGTGGNQMSFGQTLQQLEATLPYIDNVTQDEIEQAKTLQEKLELAVRYAGTKQGRKLLDIVRQDYVPRLLQIVTRLEALLAEPGSLHAHEENIRQKQKDFEAAYNALNSDVSALGQAVGEYNSANALFGNKGRARDRLRQAYQKFEDNKKRCLAISPQSSRLENLLTHHNVATTKRILG